MPDAVERFVERALEAGLARTQIRAALGAAGWPPDAIDKGMQAFAEVDCPVPVPRPRHYASAADTVLHLGLFGSLYLWLFAWLWLLFVLVDAAFPDAIEVHRDLDALRSFVRWILAWIIIAYPLYQWLAHRVTARLRADPGRGRSRARAWLIWLTLLISAAALLGDAATLVYHLLEGELTLRFLLKTAVVAVASAGMVVHLRAQVVEAGAAIRALARTVGLATAAGLLASLAAGFLLAGSPGAARQAALDEQRVDDLRAIANAMDGYWHAHQRLPDELSALLEERGLLVNRDTLEDPASGAPYHYEAVSARDYRLCGAFAAPSPAGVTGFWAHPDGTHCFSLAPRAENEAAPFVPRQRSPREN